MGKSNPKQKQAISKPEISKLQQKSKKIKKNQALKQNKPNAKVGKSQNKKPKAINNPQVQQIVDQAQKILQKKSVKKNRLIDKGANPHDIGKISGLYRKAEAVYNEISKKNLDKYSLTKEDEAWMRKILSSGTLKDQISALIIYVRDNPRDSLRTVEKIFSFCMKKSKKDSMIALSAMKDIFIEVLLPRKACQTFSDKIKFIENPSNQELFDAYFEDSIKKCYYEFLKMLEKKLQDPLLFFKKNITTYLTDLIVERPTQQEKLILSILVNKLGDNDKKYIIHLNTCLSKIIYKHQEYTRIIVKEIETFLFRANLTQMAQFYALNFLNTINLTTADVGLLMETLTLLFKLFKKVLTLDSAELLSSRILTQILRGVNKIFPHTRNNFTQFKEFFNEQVNNLFRLIHTADNFKIKIQVLLFIFQVQRQENSLNDRFYRVLYEILFSKELWNSSLIEIFFDLLFYAMKEDLNLVRQKAFLKRMLQNAIHSDPPFLITCLLFTSKIIQVNPGLKTAIAYPEGGYTSSVRADGKKMTLEDDDEEERFYDVDEEDSGTDKTKKKDKQDKKQKIFNDDSRNNNKAGGAVIISYDPYKRDPQFSNADKSCLWEIAALKHHYHPTVQKYANILLEDENNSLIEYKGNPLLDFSFANFLDRFSFKKAKKKESAGIKNLKQKNKVRRSKLEEPLSVKEVLENSNRTLRDEEQYFVKYFDQKKVREAFVTKKRSKLPEDQEEAEEEEFANDLFEKRMKDNDVDEEDDEEIEDFLRGEMEDLDFDDMNEFEDEEVEGMSEEDVNEEQEFAEMLETSGKKDVGASWLKKKKKGKQGKPGKKTKKGKKERF